MLWLANQNPGFQRVLLKQGFIGRLSWCSSCTCRQGKPRNRPSFMQILLHLDIASADVLGTPQETYFKSQVSKCWRLHWLLLSFIQKESLCRPAASPQKERNAKATWTTFSIVSQFSNISINKNYIAKIIAFNKQRGNCSDSWTNDSFDSVLWWICQKESQIRVTCLVHLKDC